MAVYVIAYRRRRLLLRKTYLGIMDMYEMRFWNGFLSPKTFIPSLCRPLIHTMKEFASPSKPTGKECRRTSAYNAEGGAVTRTIVLRALVSNIINGGNCLVT